MKGLHLANAADPMLATNKTVISMSHFSDDDLYAADNTALQNAPHLARLKGAIEREMHERGLIRKQICGGSTMRHNNNGYMRPTVFAHLLDEGQATAERLASLSGLVLTSIKNTVRELKADGFIDQHGDILSLTPDGIDAALAVNPDSVEHAIVAVRKGAVAA